MTSNPRKICSPWLFRSIGENEVRVKGNLHPYRGRWLNEQFKALPIIGVTDTTLSTATVYRKECTAGPYHHCLLRLGKASVVHITLCVHLQGSGCILATGYIYNMGYTHQCSILCMHACLSLPICNYNA